MNAADTIRALVIQGGSVELRQELAKQANAMLGDKEDDRTPIEKELDELAGMYGASLRQSGKTITPEMQEMAKRIEYLKVMKRAGRTNG